MRVCYLVLHSLTYAAVVRCGAPWCAVVSGVEPSGVEPSEAEPSGAELLCTPPALLRAGSFVFTSKNNCRKYSKIKELLLYLIVRIYSKAYARGTGHASE